LTAVQKLPMVLICQTHSVRRIDDAVEADGSPPTVADRGPDYEDPAEIGDGNDCWAVPKRAAVPWSCASGSALLIECKDLPP